MFTPNFPEFFEVLMRAGLISKIISMLLENNEVTHGKTR